VVQRNLQDCTINATAWYDGNFLKGNFKKYGSTAIGKNKENMKLAVKEFEVTCFASSCSNILFTVICTVVFFFEGVISFKKRNPFSIFPFGWPNSMGYAVIIQCGQRRR